MTNTSGNFNIDVRPTCILKEGNITVSTTGFDAVGQKGQVATLASAVSKDDLVQLSTDSGNTHAATKALIVVETIVSSGGVVGRVVTEPRWINMPTTSQTTWATMLSSRFYRVATVEMFAFSGIIDASVQGDTSNAVAPGDTAKLKYDVSDGEFKTAASGGSGVALHAVGASAASGTRVQIGMVGGALVSQA